MQIGSAGGRSAPITHSPLNMRSVLKSAAERPEIGNQPRKSPTQKLEIDHGEQNVWTEEQSDLAAGSWRSTNSDHMQLGNGKEYHW